MPTIHQRLQIFYNNHPGFVFSYKRFRAIRWFVSDKWNRHNPTPPPYVESVEATGTYQVRNYPDSFTHVIDKSILTGYQLAMLHIEREKNLPPKEERDRLKKERRAAKKIPQPAPKKRMRKPIKNPLYKVKPKLNG